MRVMDEEYHLGGRCEFSQTLEARLRAIVVEVDEQVVGEERQPDAAGDRLLGRGQLAVPSLIASTSMALRPPSATPSRRGTAASWSIRRSE